MQADLLRLRVLYVLRGLLLTAAEFLPLAVLR